MIRCTNVGIEPSYDCYDMCMSARRCEALKAWEREKGAEESEKREIKKMNLRELYANAFYKNKNGFLLHGDCVDRLKEIDDESVDLVVTSPPYDDLRTYKEGYSFDFENVAKELLRIIKTGGVCVWIVGDATINGSETGTSFRQALYFMECGFKLHDTMIWNKGSFAFPSRNRYHQVFEYMFVLSKGTPKTINLIKDRENLYIGTRGASGRQKNGERNTGQSTVRNKYGARFNVWYQPIGGGHSSKDKIAYEHPAIFPEDLVKDHILSWSNEGDVVLDPFMGSGTTAKMAEVTGRRWVGVELSEDYCNLIRDRLEHQTTTTDMADMKGDTE